MKFLYATLLCLSLASCAPSTLYIPTDLVEPRAAAICATEGGVDAIYIVNTWESTPEVVQDFRIECNSGVTSNLRIQTQNHRIKRIKSE